MRDDCNLAERGASVSPGAVMMEETEHYKGYVLIASPVEIDKYHWGIRVIIERHEGEEILRVEHEAQGAELTREKAVEPSLEFGRRIVDGHPMLRLP